MANWPTLRNAIPVLRSFFSAGDQPVAEAKDIRHTREDPDQHNDVDSWLRYLQDASPIQTSRLQAEVLRWAGEWSAQGYVPGSVVGVASTKTLWVWDGAVHALSSQVPGSDAGWKQLAHHPWRGAWSAYTDYDAGDIAVDQSHLFICLNDAPSTTGVQAPHYSASWRSLSDWSGAYSASRGYARGSVVTHQQALWYCILPIAAGTANMAPAIGSDHWWLIGSVRGERYKGPWLTRTIYVPGDIVYHDGGIFFCTAADSIASDFPPPRDATNWEAVTDFWGPWIDSRWYAAGSVVTHSGALWAAGRAIAPSDAGAEPAEASIWNRIDTSNARIDARIASWARAGSSIRVPRNHLGTGTPSADTFLRGDGTWADPHTEEQQHASNTQIDARVAPWARAEDPEGEAPFARLPISQADKDRIPTGTPANKVWKTDADGVWGARDDEVGGNGLLDGGAAHQVLRRDGDNNPEWGGVGEEQLENNAVTRHKLDAAIRSTLTAAAITSEDVPVPSAADVDKILQVAADGESFELFRLMFRGVWASGKTYHHGDIVVHALEIYRLYVDAPTTTTAYTSSMDPAADDVHWHAITGFREYAAGVHYHAGQLVRYDGGLWVPKTGSNVAPNDVGWWRLDRQRYSGEFILGRNSSLSGQWRIVEGRPPAVTTTLASAGYIESEEFALWRVDPYFVSPVTTLWTRPTNQLLWQRGTELPVRVEGSSDGDGVDVLYSSWPNADSVPDTGSIEVAKTSNGSLMVKGTGATIALRGLSRF